VTRDIYKELGVRTVINAAGTYTMVGGSRMSEETLEAMASAARNHVVIKELQQKVHERLASITRNEAAPHCGSLLNSKKIRAPLPVPFPGTDSEKRDHRPQGTPKSLRLVPSAPQLSYRRDRLPQHDPSHDRG